MRKTALEYLAEQLQCLVVNVPVIGKQVLAVKIKRFASHSRNTAARLFHEQCTGRHVPRIQTKLPESLEASASRIGKIDGRRAATAHAMAQHRKLVIKMNVDVLASLPAWEASRDQCIVESFRGTDLNRSTVQPRTGTAFGCKQLPV